MPEVCTRTFAQPLRQGIIVKEIIRGCDCKVAAEPSNRYGAEEFHKLTATIKKSFNNLIATGGGLAPVMSDTDYVGDCPNCGKEVNFTVYRIVTAYTDVDIWARK